MAKKKLEEQRRKSKLEKEKRRKQWQELNREFGRGY